MYNPETEAWIKGHIAAGREDEVRALNPNNKYGSIWNQYRPGNTSNPRTGLEPGSRKTGQSKPAVKPAPRVGGGKSYAPQAQAALKAKVRTPSKYEAPKYDMGKHVGAKIFAANREMTDSAKARARAVYKAQQDQKKKRGK